MKTDTEIMENIVHSFLIDKDDRMLNFPCAVLTMLKHKIYPMHLLAYIDERMEYLDFHSINENEIKRYSWLVGDSMFVSRMTEAFWRHYNFELTHPDYYKFKNIEA